VFFAGVRAGFFGELFILASFRVEAICLMGHLWGLILAISRWWGLAIGLYLVLIFAIGGFAASILPIAVIVHGMGLVLLVIGALRLVTGLPTRAASWGLAIVLLGIGVIAAQLIPLPPAVWTALPGRQLVVDSFTTAGIPLGWMPLSLTPAGTRATLLAILPATAVFVAILSLEKGYLKYLLVLLLVFGFGDTLLGLAQKFQGPTSALYLFERSNFGSATGTFANRNHFAAFLVIMVPMLVALSLGISQERRINGTVIAIFAFVMGIILIVGLGASESRAGVLMAMAAILGSGLLVLSRTQQGQGMQGVVMRSKWLVVAVSVAFLAVAQFGLVALLRVAETDALADDRRMFAGVTTKAIWQMLPFGSGFGSFVPVFQLFEQSENIRDSYANHAHNDWLEIALEGGIPAIAGLMAFCLWFLSVNFGLWRRSIASSDDIIARGAGLSALFLLAHSLVDYPLRSQMLMVVFALFCGIIAMAAPRARGKLKTSEKLVGSSSLPLKQAIPRPRPGVASPAPRKGPYFVNRTPPSKNEPE
jgi:hypothetical protein